jgi:hypothetical protein
MSIHAPIVKAALLLSVLISGCDRVMYTPSCLAIGPLDYGSRFSTLRNGVISDAVTGLSWYRCPFGTSYNGLNACIGTPSLLSIADAELSVRETAGKSAVSWRLPTINEFKSIVREDCENPALDPTLFPGALIENHWTSDNLDQGSALACAVYTFQRASSGRLDGENLFPFLIVTDQQLQ